jgi:cytochrome c-type biogenesis protein CcmH/NrfG
MKKYLTLLILTLVLIGVAIRPLWAQETAVKMTMQAANQLHEAGQYEDATTAYEHLVNQGVAESTLFYNLGNAYFKQGEVGRAILNYDRAARLNPRDADIQANRELARLQVVDQFSVGKFWSCITGAFDAG